MVSFNVSTSKREELIDITRQVEKALRASKIRDGLCVVFVPHTTAGVTVNENADPTVRGDIIKGLGIVPDEGYRHSEGNSPAHIKSSMIGPSLTVIAEDGGLRLGTWQGIYLAEFDGPRQRSVWVKVISG
jgi:secondary thiamine-phosphate synthase enzyme